jgi:antitoxin MazE
MTEVILDIKTWGNNLGVRLPAVIARAAHLHVNQRVKLSVVDGVVIIAPMLNEPLTLEERLAKFDPARHGGEVMFFAISQNPLIGDYAGQNHIH